MEIVINSTRPNSTNLSRIDPYAVSQEQTAIIDTILSQSNVVVNAVAGSGKTSLILALARTGANVIQLTYNSMIKDEVRKKARAERLVNLDVHSYHSLAYHYYGVRSTFAKMIRDALSKTIITGKLKVKHDHNIFVVIDEAQDMEQEFYHLTTKFIRDLRSTGRNVMITVVGDVRQNIYSFKGAKTCYIEQPDEHFDGKFKPLELSTSYRVTEQIAYLVNECMSSDKAQHIQHNKTGHRVVYLRQNLWKYHATLAELINTKLKTREWDINEIYILTASLKSNKCPIKKLSNTLSDEYNIPIYCPSDDNYSLDNNTIRDKLCFLTFHKAKGTERRIVIIYGFDASYTQFYNKRADPTICPNELYVGVTRATELLILCHHSDNDYLQFLDQSKLINSEMIQMIDDGSPVQLSPNKAITDNKSVTDLVKYINDNSIGDIVESIAKSSDKPRMIDGIPSTITIGASGLIEEVYLINSIAISFYHAYQRRREWLLLHLASVVDNATRRTNCSDVIKYLISFCKRVESGEKLFVADFLKLSNYYISACDGIIHNINQIDSYYWLDDSILTRCANRLDRMLDYIGISDNYALEEDVTVNITHLQNYYAEVKISGRVDIITDDTLVEVKCVEQLELSHYLQVIVYAWMLEKNGSSRNKIYLYNIKTDELYRIAYKPDLFNELVMMIISRNY